MNNLEKKYLRLNFIYVAIVNICSILIGIIVFSFFKQFLWTALLILPFSSLIPVILFIKISFFVKFIRKKNFCILMITLEKICLIILNLTPFIIFAFTNNTFNVYVMLGEIILMSISIIIISIYIGKNE